MDELLVVHTDGAIVACGINLVNFIQSPSHYTCQEYERLNKNKIQHACVPHQFLFV